jgi:hypothetical protein
MYFALAIWHKVYAALSNWIFPLFLIHILVTLLLYGSCPIHFLWPLFFKSCVMKCLWKQLAFQVAIWQSEWVFHLLPIFCWMSEDKGPWYPSNRWVFLFHAPGLGGFFWNAAHCAWPVWKSSTKTEKKSIFKCACSVPAHALMCVSYKERAQNNIVVFWKYIILQIDASFKLSNTFCEAGKVSDGCTMLHLLVCLLLTIV